MPGRIRDGSRSGRASNWWELAEVDLETGARISQNSHRLSLEWSRLVPRPGAWEESAIVRYRRILSTMRDLGMVPMVTLHHFTLPLWVHERGGWEWSEIVPRYVSYVQRAIESFGDLCQIWCTLNEPMVQATYGYILGMWPPGSGGVHAARGALSNMVEAHVQAYEAIHRHQAEAMVGFAKHVHLFDPAVSSRPGDRLAARVLDAAFNESVLRAFCEGSKPLSPTAILSPRREAHCTDFIGLNYYSRSMVALDLRRRDEFFVRRFANPEGPYSRDGWGEIYPEGLYRALKRLGRCAVPIYVTEFGIPDNEDALRPRFLVEHVQAMHRAIEEGVPLRGAFFWSLVDNFEWAEGWGARFGLIGVDPVTQRRSVTSSASVYHRIAQANGLDRNLVLEIAPGLADAYFGPS